VDAYLGEKALVATSQKKHGVGAKFPPVYRGDFFGENYLFFFKEAF